MDNNTIKSTESVRENKSQVVSKKVWDLENKKMRELNTDNGGNLPRYYERRISNGESFVMIDNSANPPKRYTIGKHNHRLYNLTTGDEL